MTTIYYSEGKAGLKRENGEKITRPLFDTIDLFYGDTPIHIGYIGRHPFIIRDSDGGIIDLFRIGETDSKANIESIMNWILPGLQLFYRDTDTPLAVDDMFNVGDVVRAGIFVDLSPYAGKPMHKYRYIIASSHVASLVEPGDRYPYHVLHYNSYLKVMDIYEKCGVTQFFLLHIPVKAIFSPWLGNQLNISFNDEQTLVDLARQSLDTKLELPPRELLEEKEWLDRTSEHVGVDPSGKLLSLFPALLVPEDTITFGKYVRQKAKDTDPINFVMGDYDMEIISDLYNKDVDTKMSSDGRILTIAINDVSFNMILVDGGTFVMGATEEQGEDAEKDELPTHNVTLDSFLIGETEVTQELWEVVMGYNPSKNDGEKNPVENVSWHDCKEFIRRLNMLTDMEFRLPTEAEWEFAARGGNKSCHFKYAGGDDIYDVGWYWRNSVDNDMGKTNEDPDEGFDFDLITSCKTHPVKTRKSNELGIYDMSGNVSEWCEDWEGSYDDGSATNPQGSKEGHFRMTRGSSCSSYGIFCRVSSRCGERPDMRDNEIGMRLALKAVPDKLREIKIE